MIVKLIKLLIYQNYHKKKLLNIQNMSSLNDSKINQIVNLPKLSQEEIIKYTK